LAVLDRQDFEREVTKQLTELLIEDERRTLEDCLALSLKVRDVLGFKKAAKLFEVSLEKERHIETLREILSELED